MEPPGLKSSPSSVTIRRLYLYLRAILTALSTLSTTTILPSRDAATSRYRSSVFTRVSARPSTPGSLKTSFMRNSCLLRMLVSGRKVALPALFCFRKAIISLAVSSVSVTIFCMLPPRAVSMATSYFFSTLIRSATTPIIPELLLLRSMTRLTLPP